MLKIVEILFIQVAVNDSLSDFRDGFHLDGFNLDAIEFDSQLLATVSEGMDSTF